MYMSIKNSHAARELLAAYNANTLFSKKLGGAIATDDAYAVQFDPVSYTHLTLPTIHLV